MNNIQNIDISLQAIVKNISEDSYLIPKFQRPFVWNTKDIIDLGDSIIRGYPISSLLIMPANGTLKVGSHSLLTEDNEAKKLNPINDTEGNKVKYYILDGQQRVTSISKLFLSGDNKNEYYFDLLAILVEKYPLDKINNDSGLTSHKLNNRDSFCKYFSISKDKSEKPTRENNRFISGKSIIENKFGSVVGKFLRELKDSTDHNIDKYTDYLSAVLGTVGQYSVPATIIASDSELGIVIRVFEKINSTGKKLTLFDLINAKSFQVEKNSYQGGLSDYLTNSILLMLDKKDSQKLGVNSFLSFDGDKAFEKLDRIVRIFEIADLLEKGSIPSIFKSAMLSKPAEFWFDTWNTKNDKLFEIISWMDEENIVDIGQITFLEYAAAIFLANPKAFELQKFKTEIKKYTLYLTLTDSSFSKSNLEIIEKMYAISKRMTDHHESTRYDYDSPSGNPNLTKNKILEYTTAKSGFKAIMNIFYNDKPDGKFTTDIVGNLIRKITKETMDNHHIYPKSRVSSIQNSNKFNSIANIVLLDSTANRREIKDKLPSDYFMTINTKPEGFFYCEQNLIDIHEAINVVSEVEAEKFIDNRAEKIAVMINNYFQPKQQK